MKLLGDIVTSHTVMMALSCRILDLVLNDDDLDYTVLVFSDVVQHLNAIAAITTTPQTSAKTVVSPAIIVVDDIEEDPADVLDAWIESFCSTLSSDAISHSAKTAAIEAFTSFVLETAEYDGSITFKDNIKSISWLVKNWAKLDSVCPAITPLLHKFLGNGRCHRCNGCSTLSEDGTIESYEYHLYFDPGAWNRNPTFVLDLFDGSIFEEDGSNICNGESRYCQENGTIMRCSHGQAYSCCCNSNLCDECWGLHYCNRMRADS